MDLNFSTADVAALEAASKPDAIALAELEGRTGINNKHGAMQIFVDTNISTSIYDVKPSPVLEAQTERLLPEDTFKCAIFKALNCGVGVMTYLRQLIAYGISRNQFRLDEIYTDEKGVRAVPAESKRNKAEDTKEGIPLNKVLADYLREPTFGQLNYMCKSLGVSTHAGFVQCVQILVDEPTTIRLIKESEEAMADLAEARKKKSIIREFMTEV